MTHSPEEIAARRGSKYNMVALNALAARRLGLKPGDLAEVRYRGPGWPGGLRLETKAGLVRERPYPDYFDDDRAMRAFTPPRCRLCPDGLGPRLRTPAAEDAQGEYDTLGQTPVATLGQAQPLDVAGQADQRVAARTSEHLAQGGEQARRRRSHGLRARPKGSRWQRRRRHPGSGSLRLSPSRTTSCARGRGSREQVRLR